MGRWDGCESDRVSQVLADGTATYPYGLERFAQADAGGVEYFHGDVLGSVRQLTGASGVVTLAKAYATYGDVSSSGMGRATMATSGKCGIRQG